MAEVTSETETVILSEEPLAIRRDHVVRGLEREVKRLKFRMAQMKKLIEEVE